MRPDCERCGTDLPAAAGGAFICSFECTFCAACSEALDDVCPNCGGELLDRPVRPSHLLGKNPASTERRSEEHTSELQPLMRISYAVFCLKKKTTATPEHQQ